MTMPPPAYVPETTVYTLTCGRCRGVSSFSEPSTARVNGAVVYFRLVEARRRAEAVGWRWRRRPDRWLCPQCAAVRP